MTAPILAYFGGIGPMELAIIAGIVLLLFGNRLPGAMRNMGRSVVEFKKGIKDDSSDEDRTIEPKSESSAKAKEKEEA